MSSWSRPYPYAADTGGKLTALELPTIAAGLLPTPRAVGLPVDARLVVRWRAPGRPNPCRRTFAPGRHDAALALVRSVSVAHAAPDLWRPDTEGRPVEMGLLHE